MLSNKPNQTKPHSSSYTRPSHWVASLSYLNPLEAYSHCFQLLRHQGTYICFVHLAGIHQRFRLCYSKNSVTELQTQSKMWYDWLVQRSFFPKTSFTKKSDDWHQMMAVQIIRDGRSIIKNCVYFHMHNLNGFWKTKFAQGFCFLAFLFPIKMLALKYCLLFKLPKIWKFGKIWTWTKINSSYWILPIKTENQSLGYLGMF